MIVDLIKSNLSYVDELKRVVRKTDDGLERNVLLGKIKMIEEDIDELEIPTEETKKMKLTKNVPAILLDRSVIFRPSKNEVITFVRKVILRKDYGRISENLQWCREDSN